PPASPLDFFRLRTPRPPSSTLFPYTTLFRSRLALNDAPIVNAANPARGLFVIGTAGNVLVYTQLGSYQSALQANLAAGLRARSRSEEHTSELQSRGHLVCRLLLEKEKPRILQ